MSRTKAIVPADPERAWNRLEWERAMLASMSDSDDPVLTAYREVWAEYGGADSESLVPGAVIYLPEADFPRSRAGISDGLGMVAGLRLQRLILAHLEMAGVDGAGLVSRSDLFGLLSRNVTARELTDALDGLVSRGLIYRVKGEATGGIGRPPILFGLVPSS